MATINLFLVWDYFTHMGIHLIRNTTVPSSWNFDPEVLHTLLLHETELFLKSSKHALKLPSISRSLKWLALPLCSPKCQGLGYCLCTKVLLFGILGLVGLSLTDLKMLVCQSQDISLSKEQVSSMRLFPFSVCEQPQSSPVLHALNLSEGAVMVIQLQFPLSPGLILNK